MISAGIHVNMVEDASVDRDGGVLDFCRLNDITIQPWSPFQYGFFEGVFLGSPKFPKLNEVIGALATKYGVADTTIAMAWLLRHPAQFQPVTGTMNPGRLLDCVKATELRLTREEWYAVYMAAGNTLP
jgi:predicted oxidoreductase